MRSVMVGTSTSAVAIASASCGRGHRRVVQVQPRVEQFAHARFHRFRQLAGDDDERFLGGHGAALKRKAAWMTEARLAMNM